MTLPNFAARPLPNFGENPQFVYTLLCVYYRSCIMQSLVFLTYFFQKLSMSNIWGGGLVRPPPLRKKALRGKRSKIRVDDSGFWEKSKLL